MSPTSNVTDEDAVCSLSSDSSRVSLFKDLFIYVIVLANDAPSS